MATLDAILTAGQNGKLLDSAVKNLEAWLTGEFLPAWALAAIEELVAQEAWDELNDRFYQPLAFGTGGMRSRTIGNVVAQAELGEPGPLGTPAHPAVGTNMLNDFNVIRATMGLYRYAARYLAEKHGYAEQPRLVIAHDVRHFSKHFSELAAATWVQLGGYAMVFDGPRSTPQLSFAVRDTGATAGIVITASHNPPHDNGYKVYFEDGAQVVFPHAEGIIHEVYQIDMAATTPFLDKAALDRVVTLGEKADANYTAALRENLLQPGVFSQAKPKFVFTPIHGTGGITAPDVLREVGADLEVLASQAEQDPRFPTVKSPNPENAEALTLAIQRAEEIGADVVMATDPDADRMGVAVKGEDGKMHLLTGNQTGAILAAYRIQTHKKLGLLPKTGTQSCALIKTFVTSPLQSEIAQQEGLKVIDTLTGFKWIGEKLRHYEETLLTQMRDDQGLALDYDATPLATRRELLLEHSTYYVFGGEESYGYMASDRVRDKDANAAVLMFGEVVAALAAQGKSVLTYLDEIYLRYGYFNEGIINIYYEGASGAAKIKQILASYRENPPKALGDDNRVMEFRDFGVDTFHDNDGKEIPKQDFYFLTLEDGYQYAVRGSGTEPKIKFYLFAREDVAEPADLPTVKAKAQAKLDALAKAIDADARQRAEG